MQKYIPLSGLACNPSDHDAPDGQLALCQGLIPENGALHPIALNDSTDFAIGNASCQLLYTHAGAGFSNHIIFCTHDDQGNPNPQFYYLPSSSPTTHHPSPINHQPSPNTHHPSPINGIPATFRANSVTAIGTILTLTGTDTTLHAFWNGSSYDVIDNLAYNVHVTTTRLFTLAGGTFGSSDDEQPSSITADLSDNPPTVTRQTISPSESRDIYNALIARLNSLIAEDDSHHIFRGTALAVVALQLYDGSYTAISDPFLIAPDRRDTLDNATVIGKTADGTSVLTSVSAYLGVARHSVAVQMTLSPSMRRIVTGAAVFVSLPLETWDIDTTHTVSPLPSGNNQYKLAFQRLSADLLHQKIDSLSFFRSVTLSADDLHTGRLKPLEVVIGTEEHLSLADFRRSVLTATTAYVYNSRLHLAGLSADLSGTLKTSVQYTLPPLPNSPSATEAFFLGTATPGDSRNGNYVELSRCPCKAIITFNDNRQAYLEGYCSWPLPPLVSFPDRNATHITLYVDASNSRNSSGYWLAEVPLRESAAFAMAYAINTDSSREFTFFQDTDATPLTEDIYNDITSDFLQDHHGLLSDHTTRTTNILRFSEAENPFVFPVANYVAVGAAEIVGMATSTQPISEGQFGSAPLYVFTTDATWALSVGTDGSYVARQPATRDVITSPKTILPIDSAVLFATKRGIMLLRGNSSSCISEQLDGYHFNFLTQTPRPYDVLARAHIDEDWLPVGNFRQGFLPDATMLYDYANQRLVVFNARYRYAYVYSFRSGLWGSCPNIYHSATHAYPDSYGLILLGNTLHAAKATVDTEELGDCPVLAVTRPLRLDAPFIHKTLQAAILRGQFPRGTIATVLYASNDLQQWRIINSSVDNYLRGRLGTPARFFRIAFVGTINGDESVSGIHTEFQTRWNNQIR